MLCECGQIHFSTFHSVSCTSLCCTGSAAGSGSTVDRCTFDLPERVHVWAASNLKLNSYSLWHYLVVILPIITFLHTSCRTKTTKIRFKSPAVAEKHYLFVSHYQLSSSTYAMRPDLIPAKSMLCKFFYSFISSDRPYIFSISALLVTNKHIGSGLASDYYILHCSITGSWALYCCTWEGLDLMLQRIFEIWSRFLELEAHVSHHPTLLLIHMYSTYSFLCISQCFRMCAKSISEIVQQNLCCWNSSLASVGNTNKLMTPIVVLVVSRGWSFRFPTNSETSSCVYQNLVNPFTSI